MVGQLEGENQDNAVLYEEKGNAENGDEGWDLGDLDLLRNADTPNAAGNRHILDLADPSSKLHQWFDQSIEKPFGVDNEGGHELQDGVMSYGSIMGLCENEFGVIAADSRVTYRHGNAIHTEDTVVKVVKVAPHVGMVGSGSEHIISEVKKSIKAFDFDNAMAVTMKDVDCIVDMTTSCVEKTKNLYSDITDHSVFYIVLGKMNAGFEMHTITNSHDSGRVIASRATTRIINGGSGQMSLSAYQNNNPLRKFFGEFKAVDYCSKCMKHALLEDNVHSGGDINIVLINNEKYEALPFRKSDAYGYCFAR